VTPDSALSSATALSDIEVDLVDLARATIDATTDAGPHEDGVHTMGAAVRAADGRMFVGVNIYHFTGGPCAELVALGAARAAGATELTHIVAVGNHGRGVKSPCGKDRQILADYHPGIRVVLSSPNGLVSVLASDLLPFSFDYRAEQV
jgi:cytidine deaminase